MLSRWWIRLAQVALCASATIAAAEDGAAQQSLDEAVFAQLTDGCFELLGDDNIDELEDNLARICGGEGAAPPISAASGGGAATPASRPGLLQQLQREQLLASTQADGGVVAASGDLAWFDVPGPWSLFFSATGGLIEKTRSRFEDGYDSYLTAAGFGGSYRIDPRFSAGLAFDYSREDGDFDGGGDFTIDSFGLTAFGAFVDEPVTLAATVGYVRRQHDRSRPVTLIGPEFDDLVVSGAADAEFAADLSFAEASASTTWFFGRLSLIPKVGIAWSRTDYDGYSEAGDTGLELRFEEIHETSLISTIGVGVTTVISSGGIAFVPSADIAWLHQFEEDQRTVRVSFVEDMRSETFGYSTEPPDRDFGVARVGLTAVLPNGFQPYAVVETSIGNSVYESYFVSVGINFDL